MCVRARVYNERAAQYVLYLFQHAPVCVLVGMCAREFFFFFFEIDPFEITFYCFPHQTKNRVVLNVIASS